MHTWLNYIVEANIGLLLFLLLYKTLLSKETQFSYRRFYLLGGLLLSLLFPWITIGSPADVVPTLSETLPEHWLPTTLEQPQAEAIQPTLTFLGTGLLVIRSCSHIAVITVCLSDHYADARSPKRKIGGARYRSG